jgi:hypothetical protein
MIENGIMVGSQLPAADLEAKPKAKAGTPVVRIAIAVAVVATIVGPVSVTIVGPVIRTIAAVAVPAVSITDILYRVRLVSI